MGLRLGFHYHSPFIRDGDGIRMVGHQGRFVEGLAACCDEMVCFLHTPRPQEERSVSYRVNSPNLTVVEIGPHATVPARVLRSGRFTRPVRACDRPLDAFLIRGPSPLLPAVAAAARPIPIVLMLVGDYLAEDTFASQPYWRGLLVRSWARRNAREQMRVAHESLTFVNSRLLFNQYRDIAPRIREIRTTSLRAGEMHGRPDTCGVVPYRILFTGRLVRSKGILQMIEALAYLVERNVDVVLDLVGAFDSDRLFEREMWAFAERSGMRDRVHYRGFRQVGDELFDYYKTADVYVLASTSDFEGFPRAIWEAMSHSLPVVATRVGGIPFMLDDERNAKLVEPGSGRALADGIEEVIRNPTLRRTLIAGGTSLARHTTIESVSEEMVCEIDAWLKERE